MQGMRLFLDANILLRTGDSYTRRANELLALAGVAVLVRREACGGWWGFRSTRRESDR
jgi:hypothetical protein